MSFTYWVSPHHKPVFASAHSHQAHNDLWCEIPALPTCLEAEGKSSAHVHQGDVMDDEVGAIYSS